MPIESLVTLWNVLKDYYLPEDPQEWVRIRTSKRPPRRKALSFLPSDRDEERIRALLSRVRNLRLKLRAMRGEE